MSRVECNKRSLPAPTLESQGDAPVAMASGGSEDLTGRDRLVGNVLSGWGAHLIFLVAGFLLPRLIDQRLGQATLGIWDFSWSLIAYFGLASGGVMSSVSRFVARDRRLGDAASLNRSINSGLAIYGIGGLLVITLTVATTGALPMLFGARLGSHLLEARMLILLLGGSLAVQFVFAVFNGVLTGCHRWGMHNAISAGEYAVRTALMVLVLLSGGGLMALAIVTLIGEACAGSLRLRVAQKACPEMRIAWASTSLERAREMLAFGGKSLLDSIARLILYQTNQILIVTWLGPAALAVYARPSALLKHVNLLVSKFAHVLTPTSAALDSGGDVRAVQDLLVASVRSCAFIVLPAAVVFSILGGPILEVWMGPDYHLPWLFTILAWGHVAALIMRPAYQILMGLGRHGVASLAMLGAAVCSVGLTWLAVGRFGWGLHGAALAVALPLTFTYCVIVPIAACKILGIARSRFLSQSLLVPCLCAVPFALILAWARQAFPHSPALALTFGLSAGGAGLAWLYYFYALPQRTRERIAQWTRVMPRAVSVPRSRT